MIGNELDAQAPEYERRDLDPSQLEGLYRVALQLPLAFRLPSPKTLESKRAERLDQPVQFARKVELNGTI